MIEFPRHSECRECDLGSTVENPGLPTRPADHQDGQPPCGIALLFVGQAPGHEEDGEGKSWVGWTGKLMHKLIHETYEFGEHADVYMSNVCRCRLPSGANLTKTSMKKCRPHLMADLKALVDQYGADKVYVVCLGAKACSALGGMSIRQAVSYQGQHFDTEVGPLRMFFSYHPAAMTPGKQPELIHPFNIHMGIVLEYLIGKRAGPPVIPNMKRAPEDIGYPLTVSLDIETYGILRGVDQTVFQTNKAEVVDGVPVGQQLVSVALAWHQGLEVSTAYYNLQDAGEKDSFIRVLKSLPDRATLVGTNMPFDVTFLRRNIPGLSRVLNRERFMLDDLCIVNHLHADLRPERSLKALSHLFNTANYHKLAVSTMGQASCAYSGSDPDLAYYNCTDAVSTLRIYHMITTDLKQRWKGLPTSIDRDAFRSGLLWTIVAMTEAGVAFDRGVLIGLDEQLKDSTESLLEFGESEGVRFGGTGSVKSLRKLITDSFLAINMLDDKKVAITQKQKQVSTGKNNVQLLLKNLPVTSAFRPLIEAFHSYMKQSTLRSSYTIPLLTDKTKGIVENGIAYPSWFPTPAFVKDNQGDQGGTKQARFAAHKPAVQTLPPPVKKALCSRYRGGYLMSYDLSQIELRVAALLSGDPVMIQCYVDNKDLHHEGAEGIFPGLVYDRGNPEYEPKRALGKTANFLILYRGGDYKYVETCRRDLGLEVSIDFARDAIARHRSKFSHLIAWQDEAIETVKKAGFMLLPTGWRRTFVISDQIVEDTFVNEICNFPVQTLAAQVLQSAQATVLDRLYTEKLPFAMPAQIHDDMLLDAPPESASRVDRIAQEVLKAPPLWLQLCDYYGREVPIDYEAKCLGRPR